MFFKLNLNKSRGKSEKNVNLHRCHRFIKDWRMFGIWMYKNNDSPFFGKAIVILPRQNQKPYQVIRKALFCQAENQSDYNERTRFHHRSYVEYPYV